MGAGLQARRRVCGRGSYAWAPDPGEEEMRAGGMLRGAFGGCFEGELGPPSREASSVEAQGPDPAGWQLQREAPLSPKVGYTTETTLHSRPVPVLRRLQAPHTPGPPAHLMHRPLPAARVPPVQHLHARGGGGPQADLGVTNGWAEETSQGLIWGGGQRLGSEVGVRGPPRDRRWASGAAWGLSKV